jgi:hypothetical protein
MANVQREPNGEPRLFTKLVIIKKPQLENEGYHRFLSTLQSDSDGYWKSKRHPRIREVFIVTNVTNPEIGQIHKRRINRKVGNLIYLHNLGGNQSTRRLHFFGTVFDITTGRSVCGEQKYLFPLADMRVWNAWEPQSLRRRIERAVLNLSFKSVQDYSDLLDPAWRQMFELIGLGGSFERFTNRSAASLSEFEQRSMAGDRESAKGRMLAHLPTTVLELKALVEMMERDAKC